MPLDSHELSGNRRMPEHVATQLERLILDGVFRPGQLLPSERRLCDRLRVSRSSLREGLRILRSKGIIDTRQGHGSTVAMLLPVGEKAPDAPVSGSSSHLV